MGVKTRISTYKTGGLDYRATSSEGDEYLVEIKPVECGITADVYQVSERIAGYLTDWDSDIWNCLNFLIDVIRTCPPVGASQDSVRELTHQIALHMRSIL